MPILFIMTVIFLLISVSFEYYLRRKKNTADLLPYRKDIVKELIKDIKTSKLDLILSKKGPPDSSTVLTLFEAKKYIDNQRELSLPKYDAFALFFTDNFNQVLDFRKYLHNKFLPKEIRLELSNFYNTEYIPIHPTGIYFIIISGYNEEKEDNSQNSDGLFAGNAEAFKSWLSFKESGHNLNYVIGQWILENCELEDKNTFEELDYIEFGG